MKVIFSRMGELSWQHSNRLRNAIPNFWSARNGLSV